MTPRPYLSFSQMCLWEMSPEKYLAHYVYGEEQPITQNILYGKLMADSLESDELSGDLLLDLAMVRLPKYELMDIAFEVELDDRNKPPIRILAKPDSAQSDYAAFFEYKSSVRKWTQKMADESNQITFYAMAMWLKTGKIPRDIELIDVQVAYKDNGRLAPTGEIFRFPTKRTIVDVIKMTRRVRTAWHEIQKACTKELL